MTVTCSADRSPAGVRVRPEGADSRLALGLSGVTVGRPGYEQAVGVRLRADCSPVNATGCPGWAAARMR